MMAPYAVKSRHVKQQKVYEYCYIRCEVWDPEKGRHQPKRLLSLGRSEDLDEERVESIANFLRGWVRKDSALPFDALREHLEGKEPVLRILCSRDFGMRFLIDHAWQALGYADAVKGLHPDPAIAKRAELAIFAMVVVQLVAPQSKRRGHSWSDLQLFFPEASALALDDLYGGMDLLAENYALIEKKFNEALQARGHAPVEFATDSTNVVCHIRYDDEERAAIEAERQARGEAKRSAVVNDPPIRMRGKSKVKRDDLPQVRIEAVLGDDGLIVHHKTTAGNVSDRSETELQDNVEALKRLGYRLISWAADTGYNSVKNRERLREAGFEYVLGEGVSRTKVVQEVLRTPGRYMPHPDKPEISFKCVRAEATEEASGRGKSRVPGPTRLYVIRYNEDEAAHAKHRIERHLARIEEAIAEDGAAREKLLTHPALKKYVRRDARTKDADDQPAGKVIVDRKAVKQALHLAGKSVIACDEGPGDDIHPLVLDDLYRMLGDVELLFRELKSTLKVGPIRHRKACRIEAHVMIAIMAQNIGRWLTTLTGRSIEALRDTFATLRVQEIECGNATYWQRTELDDLHVEVFQALNLEPPPLRFNVELRPEYRSLTQANHRTLAES